MVKRDLPMAYFKGRVAQFVNSDDPSLVGKWLWEVLVYDMQDMKRPKRKETSKEFFDTADEANSAMRIACDRMVKNAELLMGVAPRGLAGAEVKEGN